MKALVLAGGQGSRLRPLTQTGPKQLLPVGNKPIIHYIMEDIRASGITDVGVVVGAETSAGIRQDLQDGSRWDLQITYVHQEQPLGLAHCVLVAEGFLKEQPFLMYLGDNLLKGGARPFGSAFEDRRPNAMVLLQQVRNPSDYGVVELDENGVLKRLVEKPTVPPSNLAVTGIYFFDHHILEAARAIEPSWRNELEITDAIQWLLDQGFNVDYEMVPGWWKDTGKPDDLLEANVLILQDLQGGIDSSAKVDLESQVIGEVKIEANVEISRSVIRGPVIVGEGSKIEDSFIGPSTSLGERCVVRNSEISCSIIMEGAQVLDIPATIDWSIVGRDAVVHRSDARPTALNLILGDASKVGLR